MKSAKWNTVVMLSLVLIPALLLTGFSPFRWHSGKTTVRVHVTHEGINAGKAAVSLHTEDEIPLGLSTVTDRRGRAEFKVRQDACMFRIDYEGKVYRSDVVSLHSKKEKHVQLPLESLWRDLTAGAPPDKNGDTAKESLPRTQRIYYYINDHMGRPLMITDEDQNVVWEAEPLPFGETRVSEGATVENNLRFPGQYFDQETGLHYNYHRYYDPNTGRYFRPDPIGLAGGINPYLYATNNPVNFTDPTGEFAITGSVALAFLAAKAMGIATAWVGLQSATHLIGNPTLPSDDPCEDYHLSNFMNEATGGIAILNLGLGVGIAAGEAGAALYPEIMVAAGTPAGQKIITEYIPSMNPGALPAPTFPYGLFGWMTGATIETIVTGK
jgi:RHS repeat-associated protein